MLTVMVRFTLAALRCWRTKLQLAVLMLLASWLKGSGADVSFSLPLPLALPLRLLAGVLAAGPAVALERPVYQRTPAVPRPTTSRTAIVLSTISAAFARRLPVPRPLSPAEPYAG